MRTGLLVAATLLTLTAVAHSYLGERYILMRLFRRGDLPRLFGADGFTRRTLRFAWHLTSVAWLGFAAALALLADAAPSSATPLLRIVAVTFLLSAAVTAVASRGRHLAWPVFLAVAVLAASGTTGAEPVERDAAMIETEIGRVIDSIIRDAAAADIAGLEASHLNSDRFSKFGPRTFERQGVEATNASEAAFFGGISDYRQEVRDLKVDLFDDVAVATYYPQVSFMKDDEARQGNGRQTFVFLRVEDGWKLVHEHGTPRPVEGRGGGGPDGSPGEETR